MTEEWRLVAFHPDYAVSDQGRVKRVNSVKGSEAGRILNGTPHNGYVRIVLQNKDGRYTTKVHQLVCTTFNGPKPSCGHEVCHMNGLKSDNRAANLRWGTHAENMADSKLHGTSAHGERAAKSKLTKIQALEIKADRSAGYGSTINLARKFGVSVHTIRNIKSGAQWVHLKSDVS